MGQLITPLGKIVVTIDDNAVEYEAKKLDNLEVLCPDLLGRYQITVRFVPDGREHWIACFFVPAVSYESGPESGEDLECQAFYGEGRIKMSIGTVGEAWDATEDPLIPGREPKFDYDIDYLETGMAYHVMPSTVTKEYDFGIAWIDDVGFHDPFGYRNERDTQTWFGADPILYP